MAEKSYTYQELAEALGLASAEAARQRAMRARWRRSPGNDGKARVIVDLDEQPVRPASEPRSNGESPRELLEALANHVVTLRDAVARAEAGEERERERANEERARVEVLSQDVLRLTQSAVRAETERDAAAEKLRGYEERLAVSERRAGRRFWRA